MRALNYLNQLKYVIKEGVKIKVTVRGSESDNFYEVVSNYRILEDK